MSTIYDFTAECMDGTSQAFADYQSNERGLHPTLGWR